MDKYWTARFSTQLLLAVAPFRLLDEFGWTRNLHAVRVEPCTSGGVLLIATNGHAMGVAHDPEGGCSAPMTVYLPPAMLKACEPPAPLELFVEGDSYFPKMPGWMIPKTAFLSDAGCFICHSSSKTQGVLYQCIADSGNVHRESDYRLLGDKFPAWRKVIPEKAARMRRNMPFNPEVVAKFQAASRIIADASGPDGLVMYGQDSEEGPVIVRCRTSPNFWGCFMPMRASQASPNEAFPAWLTAADESLIPSTADQKGK